MRCVLYIARARSFPAARSGLLAESRLRPSAAKFSHPPPSWDRRSSFSSLFFRQRLLTLRRRPVGRTFLSLLRSLVRARGACLLVARRRGAQPPGVSAFPRAPEAVRAQHRESGRWRHSAPSRRLVEAFRGRGFGLGGRGRPREHCAARRNFTKLRPPLRRAVSVVFVVLASSFHVVSLRYLFGGALSVLAIAVVRRSVAASSASFAHS